MKIDVIEQILSRSDDDKKNPIKFNEMVLEHLNCKEYRDSYQKYKKINELQNNFNNQIIQFIEDNRNHLKEFLNSQYIYSPTEKQLDDYLQFYLYWVDHKKNLSNDEFESNIRQFHGQVMIDIDKQYWLSNPFPMVEEELIVDIKNRRNELVKKIDEFYLMRDEIKKSIEGFQKSLDSIIAYESVGLKGKCDIEERLRLFKKFW